MSGPTKIPPEFLPSIQSRSTQPHVKYHHVKCNLKYAEAICLFATASGHGRP
jgi:hypothetical protein